MKEDIITEAEFQLVVDAHPTYYSMRRWLYLGAVCRRLAELPYRTVLEVGAYMQPLDKTATVMDVSAHLPGTVVHDAGRAPWPFADRQFDVVVACQVIEHVEPKAVFFAEARRVARWLLLSYPFRWKAGSACHQGLDDDVVQSWAGRGPDAKQQIGCRMIHLYDWGQM